MSGSGCWWGWRPETEIKRNVNLRSSHRSNLQFQPETEPVEEVAGGEAEGRDGDDTPGSSCVSQNQSTHSQSGTFSASFPEVCPH